MRRRKAAAEWAAAESGGGIKAPAFKGGLSRKPTTTVEPQPEPGPRSRAAIELASANVKAMRPRVSVEYEQDGVKVQISHPHSDGEGWTHQLQNAFGSPSYDFVEHTLKGLLNTLQKSGNELSQELVNAVLAVVDGATPRNETEALLACQMAVTHVLAMESLGRAYRASALQQFEANANAANKLMRTFSVQIETLSRIRRGGMQKVKVEHVHVYPGGQVAVGSFVSPSCTGGGGSGFGDQAHAQQLSALAPAPRSSLRCADPGGDALPITAGEREEEVPDARRCGG